MLNNFEVKLISGKIDLSKPVRVQVSMFNPFCTGTYLFALSSWIMNLGFSSIEYQVSDTLQRHNFMWREKLEPNKALARATQQGEKWFDRNLSMLLQNFDMISISKWDFWINHNEFERKYLFFTQLFHNDVGFRDAIHEEIKGYFKKLDRNLTEERLQLSIKFLIEEIAVSEISAEHFPANEIYPGPRFGPEQYLVSSNIPDITMKEMTFVHVDFTNKSNM